MVLDNNTTQKPVIEYPTKWGFKIIGKDKEKLKACIKEVMGEKEHLCSVGNTSRTGKFTTYNASCVVESQEERDRLFKCFQDHNDVEIVI
ncbi:Proposed lipoate regulatory protein YbeD [hydrothermal vent metagenome]|uniref:Proposed lipoate regulatory protein YbeD n=1 Tax=hydrothermal vent metagenome TaxID=652676 RepID=A0A1W1E8R0_9ZZZZ